LTSLKNDEEKIKGRIKEARGRRTYDLGETGNHMEGGMKKRY